MAKIIKLNDLKKHIKPNTATLVGGVFDLFHVGHLRFLKECSKYGKPLVVIVQSDKTVRYRKGFNRPIISEDRRAEIISYLNFVDYVLILDKPSHYEGYLKKIMPKIYVFSRENMKYRINRMSLIKEKFPRINVVFLPKNVRRSSTSYIIDRITNNKADYSKIKDEIKKELYILSDKNSSQIGKISALLTKDGRVVASSGNIDKKELHAEIIIINQVKRKKISLERCKLYILISPCIMCAKEIINSGIKEVYYLHPYGNDDGVKLLRKNKIKVKKYN